MDQEIRVNLSTAILLQHRALFRVSFIHDIAPLELMFIMAFLRVAG